MHCLLERFHILSLKMVREKQTMDGTFITMGGRILRSLTVVELRRPTCSLLEQKEDLMSTN